MIKILSLGAGVQSSTILRMSIAGELPKLKIEHVSESRQRDWDRALLQVFKEISENLKTYEKRERVRKAKVSEFAAKIVLD